jgi:hypothetical protein
VRRIGQGARFVQRPSRPGDHVDVAGQAQRQPFRPRQGDHRRIVGAIGHRRRQEVETVFRRRRLQGRANGLVRCDPARHDEQPMVMRLRIGRQRPLRPIRQLTRDGVLNRIGQIRLVLLRLARLGDAEGGGLQTREGEVAILAAQEGARQVDPGPVALHGQPLQRRSARIAQAQGLGDLVESLAGRVVDGGADPAHIANAAHLQKLTMAARDQQQQKGIGDLRPQPRRDRVTLQMIDRHQRQAARQGRRLAEAEAHHHPADQTRSGRRGDPVQTVIAHVRLGHRAARHLGDHLDMAARRDLGHHPAIGRVIVDLAVNDRGQHLGPAGSQAHHRGGRLVAAGFQAQHRPGFTGTRGDIPSSCRCRAAAIVGGHLHPGRGSDPAPGTQRS